MLLKLFNFFFTGCIQACFVLKRENLWWSALSTNWTSLREHLDDQDDQRTNYHHHDGAGDDDDDDDVGADVDNDHDDDDG